MPLSCRCDWDIDPGMTYWYGADDFEKLETKRRKRCKSCGELINIGDDCLIFPQFKSPEHEIECQIYGEDGEIPRAPAYMCEKCGEIYLNLRFTAGFECLSPHENMPDLLKQYIHDFDPPKLNGEK